VSSADILADGFPHGTPAGYDQGCKSGGLCPNKGSDAMTCKDAKTRYNSDAAYRREIDGAPKPRLIEPFKKPTQTVALTDELREKLNAPDFPHGSNAGYQRGCRATVEQFCPADEAGRTCAQANREYKASYTKRREAKEALVSAGVAPADLAAAVDGSLALSAAGQITTVEAVETASAAIDDFDLDEYSTTDGPDIAVDGLLEALDDTRQRLDDTKAQVTTLEEENDRLLKLTSTQTDTILKLRQRATELERHVAASDIALTDASSDIHQLNNTIAQLSKQLEQTLRESIEHRTEPAPAAIVAVPMTIDPSADHVHLALDPQQAANVILALAGGAR
jgi:hypothetical protein